MWPIGFADGCGVSLLQSIQGFCSCLAPGLGITCLLAQVSIPQRL
jgi:hypothetical protein